MAEVNQIRPESRGNLPERDRPARREVRIIEVGAERGLQAEILLGVERLAYRLPGLAAEERRLDREERPSPIEWSVRSEDEGRPGSLETLPRVRP